MAKNNSENSRFQYTLNRSYILHSANRPLIIVAILSAVLGMLVQANRDKFGEYLLPVLIITDAIMLTVAFLMVLYFLQVRKTPIEIKIRNKNLTVDNWTFLHNTIESLKMTPPEKALNFFQARKLQFVSEGKKYKFFFGPVGAIPQKDYQKLYAEITACEKEKAKESSENKA